MTGMLRAPLVHSNFLPPTSKTNLCHRHGCWIIRQSKPGASLKVRNPKCSSHVTWPKKEDVHMTKTRPSLDSQIMVIPDFFRLVSGWSLFGILGWSWVWAFSCTQNAAAQGNWVPKGSSQMVSLWMGIYDDISKDHVGSQHDIPYTRWARRRFLHGVLGPPINGRKKSWVTGAKSSSPHP